LFRGVLQPRLGWLWASLMFGALHFPIRSILIPWSLFALAMGFVLAAFTEVFQNLWPAILLHFMINYLNLHDLAEHREHPPSDP
jgi:membrane protease YdiL (CAAX protease family)